MKTLLLKFNYCLKCRLKSIASTSYSIKLCKLKHALKSSMCLGIISRKSMKISVLQILLTFLCSEDIDSYISRLEKTKDRIKAETSTQLTSGSRILSKSNVLHYKRVATTYQHTVQCNSLLLWASERALELHQEVMVDEVTRILYKTMYSFCIFNVHNFL